MTKMVLVVWFALSCGCLAHAVKNNDNVRSVATHLKGGGSSLRRHRYSMSSTTTTNQFRIMNVASSDILWPQSPLTNLFPTTTTSGQWSGDGTVVLPSREQTARQPILQETTTKIAKVDAIVALVYFCNAFAITLPVILVPMIAQAHHLHPTLFCGAVASTAIMAGGLGKILNGIVCQRLGGISTASYYLLGVGICSMLLSMTTSIHSVRWFIAGMEFCSSAIWVACSMILSNHHSNDPLAFARSITCMSLASSLGQLSAKTGGSILLQVMDWRMLARLGAFLTLLGACVTRHVLAKQVVQVPQQQRHSSRWLFRSTATSSNTLLDQIKAVLSRRLFWVISLGHVSGYLARTCDRMLGPFLADMTLWNYQICGGLTAAVTLGFCCGVLRGKSFFELTLGEKVKQLKLWYLQAGLSLLGLALLAWPTLRPALGPSVKATLVVLCSGFLSCAAAVPFFQLPNTVSLVAFGEHKALCLAFLDGIGFFLTAPLWALCSRLVTHMGWSTAWAFMAVMFSLGGTLMVHAIHPVLVKHSNKEAV